MGEVEEAGVPISLRPAQEEEEEAAVVEEEAVEVGAPQERAMMVRLPLWRRSTATSRTKST